MSPTQKKLALISGRSAAAIIAIEELIECEKMVKAGTLGNAGTARNNLVHHIACIKQWALELSNVLPE
jgi:hypothetical protein